MNTTTTAQPKGTTTTAQSKGIEVVVVRDLWDENGERQSTGTELSMSTEKAMDMVEAGIVTRKKKTQSK